MVSLVVRQPMRERAECTSDEGEGGDHEKSTGQSGVKNFKKFRKVHVGTCVHML